MHMAEFAMRIFSKMWQRCHATMPTSELGVCSTIPRNSGSTRTCEFTFARLPQQPNIVNTSIIAAVTGSFGDVHSTKRTEGSKLFINPLMSLCWSFRLESVVRRNLYLDRIRNTDTAEEVSLAIEKFRDSLPTIRPWATIPC